MLPVAPLERSQKRGHRRRRDSYDAFYLAPFDGVKLTWRLSHRVYCGRGSLPYRPPSSAFTASCSRLANESIL